MQSKKSETGYERKPRLLRKEEELLKTVNFEQRGPRHPNMVHRKDGPTVEER